jgi:transposase
MRQRTADVVILGPVVRRDDGRHHRAQVRIGQRRRQPLRRAVVGPAADVGDDCPWIAAASSFGAWVTVLPVGD